MIDEGYHVTLYLPHIGHVCVGACTCYMLHATYAEVHVRNCVMELLYTTLDTFQNNLHFFSEVA